MALAGGVHVRYLPQRKKQTLLAFSLSVCIFPSWHSIKTKYIRIYEETNEEAEEASSRERAISYSLNTMKNQVYSINNYNNKAYLVTYTQRK